MVIVVVMQFLMNVVTVMVMVSQMVPVTVMEM
jgi:hypothetical protein